MAKLTPADVVIKELGIRPLARDLGITATTIQRWRSSARGLVPATYYQKLLGLAKKYGKNLTADDLVHGRSK